MALLCTWNPSLVEHLRWAPEIRAKRFLLYVENWPPTIGKLERRHCYMHTNGGWQVTVLKLFLKDW